MARPYLTFITDFGLDTAPATCRGVIWSIAPDARINDLSHTSRQWAVRDGAFLLWSSVAYQPVGVHLAVIDPGVGTARRGIALECARGDRFVGPDNGVLIPAAQRLGGIVAAHALENRTYWREAVSHTFHGRDIFAPVAAHLASGVPIAEVGPALDPAELVPLHFPEPSVGVDRLETSVLFVDAFGNCRLAGGSRDLPPASDEGPASGTPYRVRIGEREPQIIAWRRTFGAVENGEPLLYEDADYAGLAIGINQGSAAERLGLTHDTPVVIEPA